MGGDNCSSEIAEEKMVSVAFHPYQIHFILILDPFHINSISIPDPFQIDSRLFIDKFYLSLPVKMISKLPVKLLNTLPVIPIHPLPVKLLVAQLPVTFLIT